MPLQISIVDVLYKRVMKEIEDFENSKEGFKYAPEYENGYLDALENLAARIVNE